MHQSRLGPLDLHLNVIWMYYIYHGVTVMWLKLSSIHNFLRGFNLDFSYKKPWKSLQVMLTTEYILLLNQSNIIKIHRKFPTVPMARKTSRFQNHKLNRSGEDIQTVYCWVTPGLRTTALKTKWIWVDCLVITQRLVFNLRLIYGVWWKCLCVNDLTPEYGLQVINFHFKHLLLNFPLARKITKVYTSKVWM